MKFRHLRKTLALFLALTVSAGSVFLLFPSLTTAKAMNFGYTTTTLQETGTFVDISSWNGTVNFNKLKKSGAKGVMIRAAYGTSQDKRFDTNAAGAVKAGVAFGAYQFATWHLNTTKLQAYSKAKQQAQSLISILNGSGVTGFVAVDLEMESGSSVKMSKSDLTDVANYYCTLLSMAGYKTMLYCSIAFLYDRMVPADVNAPLWIAYYYNSGSSAFPDTKYGRLMKELGSQVYFWQYTSSASGASYGCSSKYVDKNYLYRSFTGSHFRFLAWEF